MDNYLTTAGPHLGALRTYARLLSPDGESGDRLLERTLARAISMAEDQAGEQNTLVWLLGLMHGSVDQTAAAVPEQRKESADRLITAVRDLPLHQREAIVLMDVLGRPAAEASAILGCSESTLRGRRSGGRTAIRKTLSRGGPD